MGRRSKRYRTELILFTGPMRSGKSDKLIDELTRLARYGRKKVQVFSPRNDERTGEGRIASNRGGTSFPAQTVSEKEPRKILELLNRDTQVMGIDEIHLYGEELGEVLDELMVSGRLKVILVSGLISNFRRRIPATVQRVTPLATKIVLLSAHCSVCGEPAYFTQRLIDGRPASADEPDIEVEGKRKDVSYEPRCNLCHRYEEEK